MWFQHSILSFLLLKSENRTSVCNDVTSFSVHIYVNFDNEMLYNRGMPDVTKSDLIIVEKKPKADSTKF